jgi:hypothetical protein
MNSKEIVSGCPTTGYNTVNASNYCQSTGKNLSRREQENRPENEGIIRGRKVTRDVFEELTAKHGDLSRHVKAGIIEVF